MDKLKATGGLAAESMAFNMQQSWEDTQERGTGIQG